MKGKIITIVLFLCAIVAGFLSVYFGSKYINDNISAHKEEIDKKYKPVQIVVASKDLKRGDILGQNTVALREVPSGFVNSDAIYEKDFEMVSGHSISFPVKAGDAILLSTVAQAKGGRFAGIVKNGMRALTIAVDNLSSGAGMISPGDSVDLILNTQNKDKQVTLPVLSNVNVLATGNNFDETYTDNNQNYDSITLEVNPQQAALLIHARKMGDISVILRRSDDIGHAYDRAISDDSLFGNSMNKNKNKNIQIIIGGQ